ncbi:phosphate-starvation-inducible PsiE family protein [Pseudodesulfovibrio senegalensis]|nr:phosphate-starvation-inducible PsiE family protein [Pseudodesulfovibrio senegalensis]
MFFCDHKKYSHENEDGFIRFLWKTIRLCVRVLAALMTLVIVWGIFDVVYVLYQRMTTPPYFLLDINDILATFGAFMAVLIAIEIFANIVIYLQSEMIHLRLVISTALMAAARKVIVLDYSVNNYQEVLAVGCVILALAVCYWLIVLSARHQDQDDTVNQKAEQPFQRSEQ